MEDWSWSKFFSGFISGRRYGKDTAILIRLLILVVLFVMFAYGIKSAWSYFFPKKQSGGVAQTHEAGPTTVNSEGGEVFQNDDHSTESKQVNYTIHEAPFGKGLFGMFGSQAKFQGNDESTDGGV